MNKKPFYCFALIVTLLAGSIQFATGITFNQRPLEIGSFYFDDQSLLEALGINDETLKNISSSELFRLMRALPSTTQKDGNGDNHVIFSKPASDNLQEDTPILDSLFDSNIEIAKGGSGLELISGKAAIVVAIWDYPEDEYDLGWYIEDAYNDIMDRVESPQNPYVYVKDLTNSDATWYYVWAWITWACASYENVDIYLLGHGTQMYWGPPYPPPWDWIGGYVCYDAITWYGVDWNYVYTEWDLKSYYLHNYDYSPLRFGLGGCCYGYQFENTFLDPGGSTWHDRTFIGPEGVCWNCYTWDFVNYWNYWWITVGEDSYTSFCYAYDEAEDQMQTGDPFSYAGDTIWA